MWAGELHITHHEMGAESLQNKFTEAERSLSQHASWDTDTDEFLEHSPSRGSLYYKGSALQKVIPILGGGPPLVFYKEHNVNYTFFF